MNYAEKEIYIPPDLLATPWQRFAHFLIDSVVENLSSLAISSALAYGFDLVDPDLFSSVTPNPFQELLIGILWMIAFYTAFEAATGRTVGKFITGTVVVTESGTKPEPIAYFYRSLCRLIPFEIFSFLGSGVGWHDTITKTRVVRKHDFETYVLQQYEFDEIGKNNEF